MLKDILFLGFMLFVLYGYFSYIHVRFIIYEEFLPIIVFSGIGSVVFLAGILNIMDFTWWLIIITGGILTLHSIKNRYCYKLTIGLACLLVLIVYILFFLREQRVFHYDNFSHWGMVAKCIYRESRFPNFKDSTIIFQAYPTGSACFIWFVCKFIGYSEGHALFAQAMLMISCMGPLFTFARNEVRRKKFILVTIAFLGTIFTISYCSKVWPCMHNLLVDGLLPAIAIAAFTIVFLYREKIVTAFWCVLPLLVLEVNVKNSGIIWAAAIMAEIIYFSRTQVHFKELIKYMLVFFSIIGGYIYLWKQHIALVFFDATNSNHSMSLQNYKKGFESKSAKDISYICEIFLKRCFSMTDELLRLLIFLLIAVILIRLLCKKAYKNIYLFCLIFCIAISIIYQSGNLIMYIFSMPLEEANRLAGYDRYITTLEMFLLGILVITLLQFVKQINWTPKWYSEWEKIVIILFLLISIMWNKETLNEWFVHPATNGNPRIQMESIIANNDLAEEKKSLIYFAGANDGGYRFYIGKYLLWSSNIKTVNTEQIQQLNDFEQYDYLIILDKDEEVAEWLLANGFSKNTECIKTEDVEYIKAASIIKNLKSENYLTIISVKDDASTSFTDEMAASMHELGLQNDLLNCFRKSYIAVIDGKNVVYEALGDERLEYIANLDGIHCKVVSAGYYAGNESQIKLNGTEYSNNTRGMNIVIYDKETNKAVHSFTLDTWLRDGYYTIKDKSVNQ